MEGAARIGQAQPQEQQQQAAAKVVERLNPALQQQLNLESVKTRAISLFKAISRILEDFDLIARTNSVPKWQDVLGQFSMVNLELFNIVEDIKKVSKAFVVHPKNVNAENAAILPVMISSKLLPEIEAEDNSKREQLLYGMQNLPIASQIEKLKARIDMIGAACESAEKVIADTRKTYFGSRQGPTNVPTLDKAQAAKIQEQENLLRHAVNHGQGVAPDLLFLDFLLTTANFYVLSIVNRRFEIFRRPALYSSSIRNRWSMVLMPPKRLITLMLQNMRRLVPLHLSCHV